MTEEKLRKVDKDKPGIENNNDNKNHNNNND